MADDPKPLRVAVAQFAPGPDRRDNIEQACELVQAAADAGAQVVVLPELLETPYFPRNIDDAHLRLAQSVTDSEAVGALSPLCKSLGVVVPVSIFERQGDSLFNTVVMIDADGQTLGCYRKSHIPDGPGYEEKHYFEPGDTGFRVWSTRHGRVGVGICWDQWFPECARAMTLLGAELLVYPTAIGSEPQPPHRDTRAPWRRVMQGHAVANTVAVAAANRIGNEGGQRFYGGSFVCDQWGELLVDMDDASTGTVVAELDRAAIGRDREWMGLMSDRRPELYGDLVKPVRRVKSRAIPK